MNKYIFSASLRLNNPYPFWELNHFTVPRAIHDLRCCRWDDALEIRENNAHCAHRVLHDGQLLSGHATACFCPPRKAVQLTALVTESAHGVTGVASLILLADIGDQRLGALHFDF